MTQKLYAVLVTALVPCATSLAGTAVAADAGNTGGNTADETTGNDSGRDSLPFGLDVSPFVDTVKDSTSNDLSW
jgi:hypothetical protein